MQIIENSWQRPITVRLQNSLPRTFHTLEESLDFLENEWPLRYGVHHRRAIDLCRAAVGGMITTEAARDAFISACLEASMPVVVHVGVTPESTTQTSP